MLTEEQLLKLKESYAAWFEPGDDMDLSEVADDVTKLVDEVLATRQRAETAEREREQLRGKYTTLIAETSETLQLAYQVYRDAGGKMNGNSIYSLGEWLRWLPTQTDELLDPQPRV